MDTALNRPQATQSWHDSEYSLYELSNDTGIQVIISDLGASLISILTPNREGELGEILLGYDTPQEYIASSGYLGGTLGRVANRIEDGQFKLDGVAYQLPINEGDHCHHGGPEGFHRRRWDLVQQTQSSLVLSLVSADGDNGFPGEVKVTAHFELSEQNQLTIRYEAVSDQATPINLTSHGYFNLSDEQTQVLDHELMINADSFFAMDRRLIPNYQVPVADTAFDFTTPKAIRPQIRCYDKQLFACDGFDHNYCLNQPTEKRPSATLYCPQSGRHLALYTDLPGLQLYTGNHFKNEAGRDGQTMQVHAGLCLEPQLPPNMINGEQAETCVLRPGDRFVAKMMFEFSAQ